ncbi:MAG TPA: F0F1 ATP synthase subunit epsilon [Steroidobacteraceae bacterium]
MRLKILLPFGLFASVADVTGMVVMTPAGAYGLLPRRLDCATVLTPGLLSYATVAAGEVHIAVDAGVLVKTGAEVLVCVRHAIAGADLGHLRQAVEREFLNLSEQEKSTRTTLAQLESGLIRGLVELQRA